MEGRENCCGFQKNRKCQDGQELLTEFSAAMALMRKTGTDFREPSKDLLFAPVQTLPLTEGGSGSLWSPFKCLWSAFPWWNLKASFTYRRTEIFGVRILNLLGHFVYIQ